MNLGPCKEANNTHTTMRRSTYIDFFARTCGLRRIYTPEIKKRKKEIKKSKQERKQEVGIEPALTGSQNTHADHNKSQLTLLFVARCLQLRGIYTPGATGNTEKNKNCFIARRTRTQVHGNGSNTHRSSRTGAYYCLTNLLRVKCGSLVYIPQY